jgi:hypothetical protein
LGAVQAPEHGRVVRVLGRSGQKEESVRAPKEANDSASAWLAQVRQGARPLRRAVRDPEGLAPHRVREKEDPLPRVSKSLGDEEADWLEGARSSTR